MSRRRSNSNTISICTEFVGTVKVKLALLYCLLLVIVSGVQAQTPTATDPSQWKRYTASGEEFSVTLPALPAMMTDIVYFAPPSTKHRVERTLMTTANGVLYAVFTRENVKPQQSLADFVSEQTAMRKPGTITERPIEINGFAGTEVTPIDKNQHMMELFFATKQHLYRFRVNGAAEDDARVKQFLSSIMLEKDSGGTEVSDGPGAAEENAPDEQVYSRTEVDVRPHITLMRNPQYSEEARQHRITGTVVLKAALSSTGQLTHITVVSGLPYGLIDKSIAAARMLEFVPGMKDGKPVSVWTSLEYNFSLY